jgi:AraC-like DNA-binding protein
MALPKLWTQAFLRRINPETRLVGFHRAEPGLMSPWYNTTIADFDVWYVANGTGAVLADNRWTPFAAGDLITLKPGALFQRERSGVGEPFQIYFAHILPFGRRDGGLNKVLMRAWPAKLSLLHRPELPAIFDRLFESYAARTDERLLAIRGLTLQLLDVIFQELRRAPATRPPRAYRSLLQAKALMETQYPRALRLDDIAEHCGLSASHLTALFTRHFGHSPIEYLVRVRLREAKLLLAKGARVKEAAAKTGFRSQHYFARAFKKRTGLAPTEFAARQAIR